MFYTRRRRKSDERERGIEGESKYSALESRIPEFTVKQLNNKRRAG